MDAIKDIISTKLPPYNLEAEKAVLGAILIQNEALPKTIEILQPEDYYRDSHRKIYQVMLRLFEKNEPIDLLTLNEELRKSNELEDVGGAAYLASLAEEAVTAANVIAYANIIKEKAILRELINISTDIITRSYTQEEDVDTLLDSAESLIFRISEQKIQRRAIPIRAILKDTFEAIEKLYQKKAHITGIPTGFTEFDSLTSGLQASDLIIIAGRPSMGKTSFCLNIAEYAGIDLKIPVVIFSLEMSKEQIVQRMLCSQARVNAHHLRTGFLSEKDWPKLTIAAGRLAEAPIFIDDTPAMTALELRAKARRLKAEHNLGLIIVDYLQLMRGRAFIENRQQEIAEISRSLKAMAKELAIPVVALSQLSRAVEARQVKRPQLSDLRESGALEQDGDLIAFLYRPEGYGTPEEEGLAEVRIEKQRNGPTGTIKLTFIREYTRFENSELKRKPNF